MSAQRRGVELNAPSRQKRLAELRRHLETASNELYLFELRSLEFRRPVPPAVARAHKLVRGELARLLADAETPETPETPELREAPQTLAEDS